MEELLVQPDLLSISKRNLEAYFDTHDVQYVTEDAVFTIMETGDEYKGREGIRGMLNYFYKVAFDAHAEKTNSIITETKAMVEGYFVGRHIGEFGGLKPTNKEVRVPMCVCYDLEEGLVKKGRIYFSGESLVKQLS